MKGRFSCISLFISVEKAHARRKGRSRQPDHECWHHTCSSLYISLCIQWLPDQWRDNETETFFSGYVQQVASCIENERPKEFASVRYIVFCAQTAV